MVETSETWTETTYDQKYACEFKFNTLIDISPRSERPELTNMGSNDGTTFKVYKEYPIYKRDFYKQDRAPMKKMTRYVSPVIV